MEIDYVERAARLWPGRSLLGAQEAAAAVLRGRGRGVVVLPTGAGKTLLAALPFAAGVLRTRQMVFMTPLRTLTDAQTRTLREEIDAGGATEFLGVPWEVKSQTGTAPEDPLFTAPAVVCTFDQALSSAASIAYSTSPRRRGINAAAVLGAYLVCDEVHLFPRNEALTTLLWLLKHRPPELPFLLMTATLSRPIARAVAELLDAEVIDGLSQADVRRLGLAERRRVVEWQEEPLNAVAVAAAARESPDGRTIVVVNTVERARELGATLAGLLGRERVLVLHGRFYPEDRGRIEGTLGEWMGKEASPGEPVVLVATQVVEAGLDISAGVLFTEWAPANALVQRWGRCVRWGGEGRVVVAPPAAGGVDGLPRPYDREAASREVLALTRRWLREEAGTGLAMTAEVERSFLDAAHGAADAAWVEGLTARLAQQAGWIGEAIQDGLYSHAGGLIRRVDNRTVLVHGAPEEMGDPWRASGFSLPVGTLHRLLRGPKMAEPVPAADEDDDLVSIDLPAVPWTLQRPIWEEGSERRSGQPARWEPATRDDLGREQLFVVNPALVSYDERLGLGFGGGEPTPPEWWARPLERAAWTPFPPYRRETYAEHVRRMIAVLDGRPPLWPTAGAIAEEIERWCAWPPGMLRRVAIAAILLHDAGKLTRRWQEAIGRYQREGGQPVEPWLVHSDERAGVRLDAGPHALAGAAYSVGTGEAFDREANGWREETGSARWDDEVLPSRVLFTAIATHHGADPWSGTTALGQTELLDSPAIKYLGLILRESERDAMIAPQSPGISLNGLLVSIRAMDHAGRDAEYLAVSVVSRLLRLADGWSQEA